MHHGPERIGGVMLAALAALGAACSSTPAGGTTSGSVTQLPAGSSPPSAGHSSTPSSGSSAPTSTSMSGASGASGVGGSALATAGSSSLMPTAGAGALSTAGTDAAGTAANGGTTAPAVSGMDMGNYFVSGPWHGYAWTTAQGAGSTIEPMDFSMQTTGMPRCVKGSVAMTTDYSGIAMLGLNLNQDNSTGAAQMTVTPTQDGLMYDVTNTGGSLLRVQIQTPDGATDANARWCAAISDKVGFIPWTGFNTMCWDGSGTAYAKQPISQLSILVPGTNAAAVPFDFCLNSVSEAASPTMPATAGSGATGAAGSGAPVDPGSNSGMGTIVEQYGVAKVMRDGRNYVIQNNVWGNNTQQNITYDGTTYEITKQTGNNVSSGPSAMGPVSYPSVFIGSNYERTTEGSNLPIAVSAIKSVKTAWSVNAGSAVAGTYNAAYDVWFSTGPGGDPEAPSGGYLMVWFYKPPNAQPIGPQPSSTGVTIPGVSGTWDIWIGPNTGNANRPVISYVRTQPTQSLEFDLNAFIQDALKRPGAIQSGWYLSNVFAGFEIWNGGVGLKTNAFYAIVE